MSTRSIVGGRLIAVVAVALAVATSASMAQAAPATPQPQTRPSIDIWPISHTFCLGKKDTRNLIKVLNTDGDIAGTIEYVKHLFPEAIGGPIGAALRQASGYFKEWARDIALAYLHSGRRGAKVKVGLRFQIKFGGHNGPRNFWLDGKKRGRTC